MIKTTLTNNNSAEHLSLSPILLFLHWNGAFKMIKKTRTEQQQQNDNTTSNETKEQENPKKTEQMQFKLEKP